MIITRRTQWLSRTFLPSSCSHRLMAMAITPKSADDEKSIKSNEKAEDEEEKRKLAEEEKKAEEKKRRKMLRKNRMKREECALAEFLDLQHNWGKLSVLSPSDLPGRAWTKEELQLKSGADLHKLWYVLLKERNMLLTMQHAYAIRHHSMPNPERLDRVKESMDNLEAVVHQRNDAFLQLETGDSASPPKRTITSFMGFTYEETATEHYLPAEAPEAEPKQYEVPLLDEQTHLMQLLWREKEQLKKEMAVADEYLFKDPDRNNKDLALVRPLRSHFNRVEDLPEQVVARRRREWAQFQPPSDPYSAE